MTENKKNPEEAISEEELGDVSGGASIEDLSSKTLSGAYQDTSSDLDAAAQTLEAEQEAKASLRDHVSDLKSSRSS